MRCADDALASTLIGREGNPGRIGPRILRSAPEGAVTSLSYRSHHGSIAQNGDTGPWPAPSGYAFRTASTT